jgi:hypothetical protein
MNNLIRVSEATEFRDAVFELAEMGRRVYARLGEEGRTYRIIHEGFGEITIEHLRDENHSPVTIEVMATAIWRARGAGRYVPEVLVFTG